jgi:hypothetical protein
MYFFVLLCFTDTPDPISFFIYQTADCWDVLKPVRRTRKKQEFQAEEVLMKGLVHWDNESTTAR